MRSGLHIKFFCFVLLPVLAAGCGDDEAAHADRLGIAAECEADEDCAPGLSCVLDFKNGYCGLKGCTADPPQDATGPCPEGELCCPAGAVCVAHGTPALNYCFRSCLEKPDCNANRSEESAANCVGSIDPVDPGYTGKACEPPSGS